MDRVLVDSTNCHRAAVGQVFCSLGICGRDAKVLRESSYPEGITVSKVQAMFSASSDHALFDRVVECSCGMIYITPRLDAELIEGGYSSGADTAFVAQEVLDMKPFWQELQVGNALQSAASTFALAKLPQKAVSAIGPGSFPFTYNLGQTLAVARRNG